LQQRMKILSHDGGSRSALRKGKGLLKKVIINNYIVLPSVGKKA
jgi:hypothetical protein